MTNVNVQGAALEAALSIPVGKKWYQSKTFWTNIVAGLFGAIQAKYGFVVPAEYQMILLSGVNAVLRKFTNTPIVW